ncbi:hypothetical protein SY88_14550 [Clostridiales bacterium PH28_bin88]|nr:hypothetical protein SY88_14550 [Clostridiales bacterium PH28_bin88]
MIDGTTLKKLRENLDFSLEEVAEKTNLPCSYLKDVEQGRKKLSPRNLTRLASVLPLETSLDADAWASAVSTGLGDKVRALRKDRRMTLNRLAELTGLSVTYLSEIERGTIVPSLSTLKSLAEVFDMPVSLFINNERKSSLVGEKLKRIRSHRGFSQKELASLAGVSPGLVGQLETGRVQASLATVEKIAKALGVSVCSLILEQDEVDAILGALSHELREMLYDPKVQMILGSICTMNEEKMKLVLNFIDMLNNPKV